MGKPMNDVAYRLLFGFGLSFAIGWLAWRRKSLSRSGVAGAMLTGTLIFGFAHETQFLIIFQKFPPGNCAPPFLHDLALLQES